MHLNARRVIAGGLVSGVIIIILNIAAQLVLGGRVQREMNAWIPGSANRMTTTGGALVVGIIMKFIVGTVLIWLYAAVRPRFGPGPRTAAYVAVSAWILGAIFFSDFPLMGMMSATSYAILEVLQLFVLLVAALAGARLYTEQAS